MANLTLFMMLQQANTQQTELLSMRKHKRFITQPSHQPSISTHKPNPDSPNNPNPALCKQAINFYKKTSKITLPVQSDSPKPTLKNSQFKRFPQRPMPSRNNLRCLNQFLKQQAFFIKHKERIVSNLSNKQIANSPLGQLKEKIVNMIKLQTTQSELLLKETSLESFNNVHFTTFELDYQPTPLKMHKEQHPKHKIYSSVAKSRNNCKPQPQRLISLTPLLRSPLIAKKDSSAKLKKTIKLEQTSIGQSALSKNYDSSKSNQESKLSCHKIEITFNEHPQ